jgi:Anti-sigma factor NepR
MTQTTDIAERDGLQPRTADDGLAPNLQAHIGRHLRAVFDEVASEPIPDRLLRLLQDLEQSGDK